MSDDSDKENKCPNGPPLRKRIASAIALRRVRAAREIPPGPLSSSSPLTVSPLGAPLTSNHGVLSLSWTLMWQATPSDTVVVLSSGCEETVISAGIPTTATTGSSSTVSAMPRPESVVTQLEILQALLASRLENDDAWRYSFDD